MNKIQNGSPYQIVFNRVHWGDSLSGKWRCSCQGSDRAGLTNRSRRLGLNAETSVRDTLCSNVRETDCFNWRRICLLRRLRYLPRPLDFLEPTSSCTRNYENCCVVYTKSTVFSMTVNALFLFVDCELICGNKHEAYIALKSTYLSLIEHGLNFVSSYSWLAAI